MSRALPKLLFLVAATCCPLSYASAKPALDTLPPRAAHAVHLRAEAGTNLDAAAPLLGRAYAGRATLGRLGVDYDFRLGGRWRGRVGLFALGSARTLRDTRNGDGDSAPDLRARTLRLGLELAARVRLTDALAAEAMLGGRNRRDLRAIDARRPANWRADLGLGLRYDIRGRWAAIAQLRRALVGEQTDFIADPRVHLTLGTTWQFRPRKRPL